MPDANSKNQVGSLKENYGTKKGKKVTKIVAMYADGGEVIPEGAIPLEEFNKSAESKPVVDNSTENQTELPPGAIPADEFNEQKYGTTGQMAITALEGAAKGIAGPVATLAEKHLLGVPEEDIRAREETNPITHGAAEIGALGASLLVPGGIGKVAIGNLVGKAGEAAVGAAHLADAASIGEKIGKAAVQGATEMGLLQSSDELSKMILNDPNQSWQTAAVSIPLSATLGAVGGGAIGAVSPLWKATVGPKVTQFIEDARGRAAQYARGVDPKALVTDELSAQYQSIKGSIEKLASMPELESKAISKVLPDMEKAVKSFEKKFTTEVEGGVRVVDTDKIYDPFTKKMIEAPEPKIATLPDGTTKELYDPFTHKHELKNEKELNSFIDVANKYKNAVEKESIEAGIKSPIESVSLAATKHAMGETTPGAKFVDMLFKKSELGSEAAGAGVGAAIGHSSGIPGGGFLGAYIGSHAFGPLFKTIIPSIAKTLFEKSANSTSFKASIDYLARVVKGDALMGKAAKNLFKASAELLPEHLMPSENSTTKLDKLLLETHKSPDSLMETGNNIGHYLADHSTAAVANLTSKVQYLNSVRPNTDKMHPLDSAPVISSDKKAQWNQTLRIAEQPLVVINKIKEGTITPRDIMDLKSTAPEAYNRLASKISSEMADHISKGELVPYKTRIGLSLFLGQGLDSTLTPMGISSAQPAANSPQQSPQNSKTPASKTNKLDKYPQSFQTPGQARAAANQKS